MDERLEASVHGRVQMVMYRDFATRKARRLGLVGEVKNLPDGSVRVIAEGPRDALDRYVEKLKRGPILARVDEVDTVRTAPSGAYESFDIRYD